MWEHNSLFILLGGGNFFMFTHPGHPLAEMRNRQGFYAHYGSSGGGPGWSHPCPASAVTEGGTQAAER